VRSLGSAASRPEMTSGYMSTEGFEATLAWECVSGLSWSRTDEAKAWCARPPRNNHRRNDEAYSRAVGLIEAGRRAR
jgi:hypothetical protein